MEPHFNHKERIIKDCLSCGIKMSLIPARKNAKFCSQKCAGIAKKGKPSWNKGLLGYKAGENHHWFGLNRSREKSPTWKGKQVGYRGLHIWVQNELGTPDKCEHCLKTGTGHFMHWANISGKYLRDKDDWKRLCPKCHKSFDKEKNYKTLRQMAY